MPPLCKRRYLSCLAPLRYAPMPHVLLASTHVSMTSVSTMRREEHSSHLVTREERSSHLVTRDVERVTVKCAVRDCAHAHVAPTERWMPLEPTAISTIAYGRAAGFVIDTDEQPDSSAFCWDHRGAMCAGRTADGGTSNVMG